MTALTSLLGNDAHAESSTDVPRWNGLVSPRHVAPKAKRVIFLYMAGGPSHLETFDHRPQLTKLHGQPMPESFTKGQPIAQLQGKKLTCMAPQHRFRKCGDSGIEISTAFEHLPQVADELCIVRSLRTEAINHDPAHTFMNTGTSISGRPAIGSWLLYGLGSPSNNLPGFIVMTSTGGGQSQPISARQWHSGFLPGQFQGVHFNSTGDPVLYVRNPAGVTDRDQRDVIDIVTELNRQRQAVTADLLVSGALFAIGLLGVIVRRNLLIIYMSLELMLNAANVALVAMSRFNGNLDGQVMVFFIITVAAAEVSVGLALIVALYRKRQTADVEDLATMKL